MMHHVSDFARQQHSYSWIEVNGTKYHPQTFFVESIVNGSLSFGKIEAIYAIQNHIVFHAHVHHTVAIDETLNAYVIHPSDSVVFVNHDSVKYFEPLDSYMHRNAIIIPRKYNYV